MNLEWNKLRSWNGTIQNAFEELCCQLAAQEKINNSKFIRKGTPDGGVECYWKSEEGDIAWQAKFFTTTPTTPQWTQVFDSLKKAVEKHSKLKKFTVCFPLNRSGSEEDHIESFMVQWDENVEKWRSFCQEKGLEIEFDYWGDSEIWTRLTKEENRGKHFFWFEEPYFSDIWFTENLENELPNAGPRYQPQINVELEISKIFDGIGRTKSFQDELKRQLGKMRKMHQDIGDHEDVQKSTDLLNAISIVIENLEYSSESIENEINSSTIKEQIDNSLNMIYENISNLNQQNTEGESAYSEHPSKYFFNNIEKLLIKLNQFIISKQVQLANKPYLLITGRPGVGKTHLLCDVAKKRIENNLPTLLIFNSKLNQDDPWIQISRYFGFPNLERDKFLEALNTAAEARNSRTLLVIDAINEGESKRIWKENLAGMITLLTRYPRLGLVLSIRKSYEHSILPENISEDIIKIEHEGFGEQVFDAMEKFFEFYNIEVIDSPLLLPEFYNPQFLLLFCKVMENNKLPSNQINIMTIFDKILEKTNEKLSNSEVLNYNINQKIVQKSVNKIAELMYDEGKRELPSTKVEEELNKILQRAGYDNSLLYHLIAEGLVFENNYLVDKDTTEVRIQFSYERFSDYLIAKNWIEGKELSQLEETIRNSPLSNIFSSDESCWNNQGVLEALSIIIPNEHQKELFEIIPEILDFSSLRSAFVDSLKWRKHTSFTEKTFGFIESHVLAHMHTHEMFWETVIQISATPNHPLNALWLDKTLTKYDMAERDAWWSILIHDSYSRTNAVFHLIHWAWKSKNQKYLNEESIELLGITLSWFLTSSNRFIRDRATKALVALLTNHIEIFQKIFQRFQNVNDPYVLERILAAGYGCAMRSNDNEKIKELAQKTYQIIFENNSPPIHITIRDYARGIIELSLHRKLDVSIDAQKILPPYGSEWPEIPTLEEVEQYHNYSEGMTREETSQLSIYVSVMDNDFARYVLGTNHGSFQWKSERIDDNIPIMKAIDDFFEDLDFIQCYIWENCKFYIINKKGFLEINETRQKQYFGKELENKTIEEVLKDYVLTFENCLSEKQLKFCKEKLLPYLEQADNFTDFDISLLQRWILKKVFDFGWTVKRFGRFDRDISETYSGRNTDKAERIGKKYQWIAYHEILARVADNFEIEDTQRTNNLGIYDGTWQISHGRDIDPSVIIEEIKENFKDIEPWWHKVDYVWKEKSNEEWVQDKEDLPDFKKFIDVKDNNDRNWLNLDSNYNIKQEIPPEEEAFKPPKRSMWFHLRSYLVHDSKFNEFWEELKSKDFFNNWMPNSHPGSFYGLFVGEYPWSTGYRDLNTYYYGHDGWSKGSREGLSRKVLSTTEHITLERGYDCSINGSFQIILPIEDVVNNLKLNWCGKEGYFFSDKKIIAVDPSIQEGLPDALLIDKEEAIKFLKNNEYRIFWTIIGEKTVFGGEMHNPAVSGSMNINAIYTLNENDELVETINPEFEVYPDRR